jgi:hypothetical protein
MFVISECLNSECRRALYYLRGGRILRIEYLVGMCLKLEYFWLCDDCSQCYDFCVFADRPAVAIRCERNSQRFVRTEEAAFLSRGQQLKESVGSSTVMTQLWGWESDPLLSRPGTGVPQKTVEGYLSSNQGTSEYSDALLSIRT